jgi:hypothetical protein
MGVEAEAAMPTGQSDREQDPAAGRTAARPANRMRSVLRREPEADRPGRPRRLTVTIFPPPRRNVPTRTPGIGDDADVNRYRPFPNGPAMRSDFSWRCQNGRQPRATEVAWGTTGGHPLAQRTRPAAIASLRPHPGGRFGTSALVDEHRPEGRARRLVGGSGVDSGG